MSEAIVETKIEEQYHIEPIGNRVVVERIAPETTTKSGIVLTGTEANKKLPRGWVRAIGPGLMNPDGSRVAMSVAVGDFVIFNHYVQTEFDVGGKGYLVMNEEEILGVVKKRKVEVDENGKELRVISEEEYDSIPGKQFEGTAE